MKNPLPIFLIVLVGWFATACSSTPPAAALGTDPSPRPDDIAVGGPCENCEAMYEGMPPMEQLSEQVTLAAAEEPGDRLEIHGILFQNDGKTPAPNILIYFYHTDANGLYSRNATQTEGRIHGHLRGWVRTGKDGRFHVRTIRPAAYPNRKDPAHIHMQVKEPGRTLYWIDEIQFADDPLVTAETRARQEHRGGDFLITPSRDGNGTWQGSIEIVLGENVPDYPGK